MDGSTFETSDVSADCACENNCQECGAGGDFDAAPYNCITCKSTITTLTTGSEESWTGLCEDLSPDDYFAEMYDYYLEYYGEEYEYDDEASASTIQTGLAAVTMAVML